MVLRCCRLVISYFGERHPNKQGEEMRYVTSGLLMVVFALSATPGITQEQGEFDVEKISERVVVVTSRVERTSQLAIASERGIVVFDTHWSNTTAGKFRAAIAEAFGRDDFIYTINHVERLDLFGGNEAYKDTTIIAHEYFREVLDQERVDADLKELIKVYRWREEVSRERVQTLEPGSEEAKREKAWLAACTSRIEELEQGITLCPPTVYYSDRMTLDLGDLTLRLIYFGKAGYNGITVFHVPEERLAIISNFIMHRAHLAPHPQADYVELDVPRWIAVLEELLGDEAGVDRVICDINRVWPRERALKRLAYIKKLWEAVKALAAEGLELEEVQERLSLDAGFSFVKEMETYKERGDEWVRPQHMDHITGFYLQHRRPEPEAVKE